ncbi:uncharacterized protein TNCV_2078941 [Trichonephila clavipes]|nr:uncharacterized protein TNCV_2078941 [Trichonephila clavipes]
MEVEGILRIFNRSEKLHNLKYSNYIEDGDTKTFNALSEKKPYGDDHLIQKIECVGHVQKRMGTRLRKFKLVHSKKKLSDGKTIGGKGRLTDSLIDKLAHYYGNAIRCNSTSVKEMRKAIWAVWGHSCSTDDEPMHWFCPTNPNTWCKYNATINNNLQNYKHKPSVAKAVREFCPKTIGSSLQIAEIAANLATSVFNDGNQILITILEKFGLKINRNVCVSLAERDNRRIFTSRQRRLESSFEARRAKKIKKSKEIELFQEQEASAASPRCWSPLSFLTFRAWPQPYFNRIIRDHTRHALSKCSSSITRLNCFPGRLTLQIFHRLENMWSMVAQLLTQNTPPAATPDLLWQRVEADRCAVPQEHVQSIFESMPRRVAAVISNNGGYSGY